MRFLVSTLLGISVALGLFLLMHTLITGGQNDNRDRGESVSLDFIQVDQDQVENIRKRTPPPKPEPPKKPPPPPKITVDAPDRPQQQMPDIDMPKISIGVGSGQGPYLGNWSSGSPSAEGDVIPIVRIQPQYPR